MLMQIVPMITRMLMAIMLYSRKRRHMQGDAKVAMHPQISIITCHFVLWEAVSPTKCRFSLTVKVFGPKKIFGMAAQLAESLIGHFRILL